MFVSSGYARAGGIPGNVLLAFSVDGRSLEARDQRLEARKNAAALRLLKEVEVRT